MSPQSSLAANQQTGEQQQQPKPRLIRQQPAPQQQPAQFQRLPQPQPQFTRSRPPQQQALLSGQQLAAGNNINNEQQLNNQQPPSADQFRPPADPFQPRFQRLRTPPGGTNQEQFLSSQQQPQLHPLAPLPLPLPPPPPPPPQAQPSGSSAAPASTQFGQQNQRQQQQQQTNNGFQLAVPTLSAFDLSSLANLANQAQFSPQQQQTQPQQPFRRLPQAQQQQQQQQRANNNNQNPFDQRQPQNSGFVPRNPAAPFAANSQTELPFVRQVFRPAQQPAEVQPAAPLSPLDVGSGQQEGERASQRPTPPPLFVPGRTISANGNNNNKVTRLVESGFSPMQSNLAAQSGREVFFEPATNSANRFNTNQQQSRNQSRPSAQSNLNPDQQQQQQARKPPVRRPSQRPQLPAANQQRQQSDVIRLASSAIQAANEGLASLSSATTTTQSSSSLAPLATTTAASPTTTSRDTELGSSSSTPAGLGLFAPTFEQPATTTATTSASTLAQPPTGGEQSDGRRATPAQSSSQPPRSSASFFALTSAATSSPSSFSPALPINQAVAASGGRRRIPVRGQQSSTANGQSRAQTTTPANFFGQSSAPTTTTSPLTTTTTQRQPSSSPHSPVRRPEIEEFYETIGGNLNGGPSTTIDGFGAPSRGQAAQSQSSSSQTSSGSREQAPPTTPAGEFYGSRLSSEQPSQPSSNQEPAVAAAPARQSEPVPTQQQAPVLVPVTYLTTLTYLTTVLHGTHTLETSHESVVKSTELATLNAQLMDQIEHRRPLIEPTATLGLSSKTKGKGTTIVNLKSLVSAFNQELVDALAGQPQQEQVRPTATASPASQPKTVGLADLQAAKKSLLTEYVYSYTINNSRQNVEPVTSVRSELVTASLSNQQLLQHLQRLAPAAGGEAASGLAQPIDSNGLLRVNNLDGREETQLNLGKCCAFLSPPPFVSISLGSPAAAAATLLASWRLNEIRGRTFLASVQDSDSTFAGQTSERKKADQSPPAVRELATGDAANQLRWVINGAAANYAGGDHQFACCR